MSLHVNSKQMAEEIRDHLNKSHHNNTTRLICLIVGKGVAKEVNKWRDTNKKAERGIRRMEFNAFMKNHRRSY